MASRNKQHLSNAKKARLVDFDDDSADDRDQHAQQQADTIQFLFGLLEKAASERDEHMRQLAEQKTIIQKLARKTTLEEKSFRKILAEERAKFDKRILRNKVMLQRRDDLLCEWAKVATELELSNPNPKVTKALKKTVQLLPAAKKASVRKYLRLVDNDGTANDEDDYSSDNFEESVEGSEDDDNGDDRGQHKQQQQHQNRDKYSTSSVVLGNDDDGNNGDGTVSEQASLHSSKTLQMSLSDASLQMSPGQVQSASQAVTRSAVQSIGDGSLDKLLFGGSVATGGHGTGESIYAVSLSSASQKKSGVGHHNDSEENLYDISVASSLLAGMNATAATSGKSASHHSASGHLSTPLNPSHTTGSTTSNKKKNKCKKKEKSGSSPSAISTSSSQPQMPSSANASSQLASLLGLSDKDGSQIGPAAAASTISTQHKGYTVVEGAATDATASRTGKGGGKSGSRRYWWDHLVDNNDDMTTADAVADNLILGSGLDGEGEQGDEEAMMIMAEHQGNQHDVEDELAEQAAEKRADAERREGIHMAPEGDDIASTSRSVVSLNPGDYDISESNELPKTSDAVGGHETGGSYALVHPEDTM